MFGRETSTELDFDQVDKNRLMINKRLEMSIVRLTFQVFLSIWKGKRRMTNQIKNVCKHAATAALVLISLFAISGCQATKTNTTAVSDKEKR